ncbi:MAG: hypothetical protein ACK4FE_09260 [Azonexus sp.]
MFAVGNHRLAVAYCLQGVDRFAAQAGRARELPLGQAPDFSLKLPVDRFATDE